ncbi:MAG: hypothetical protein M3O30_07370 [Planctomycetota bacterium]|nr:hypothetical protein [Planctomycetota bacterium]
MAKMQRNEKVEAAVKLALNRIDKFIGGDTVQLPNPAARRIADGQLQHRSASVRVASMFFVFYSLYDDKWDCNALPVGYRGEYGDKLFAEQLSQRHVTLHDNITAFGENLGWKGSKVSFRLFDDVRFQSFVKLLAKSNNAARRRIADYVAARFAESRQELKPLPPVGDDVLTYARAKLLLHRLIVTSSEGHIQQFLIAALLSIHRSRYGIVIRTHHPLAADKYDETAGDIEEFHDGALLKAYEITVRPDWKNRLSVFKAKMDRFSLSKYVIIAANVNDDDELAEPANLITFLKPYGRDLAVIDILDVCHVMAAELTATELRRAINLAYNFLSQPRLSGRPDVQVAYRDVVNDWLDQQTSTDGMVS